MFIIKTSVLILIYLGTGTFNLNLNYNFVFKFILNYIFMLIWRLNSIFIVSIICWRNAANIESIRIMENDADPADPEPQHWWMVCNRYNIGQNTIFWKFIISSQFNYISINVIYEVSESIYNLFEQESKANFL